MLPLNEKKLGKFKPRSHLESSNAASISQRSTTRSISGSINDECDNPTKEICIPRKIKTEEILKEELNKKNTNINQNDNEKLMNKKFVKQCASFVAVNNNSQVLDNHKINTEKNKQQDNISIIATESYNENYKVLNKLEEQITKFNEKNNNDKIILAINSIKTDIKKFLDVIDDQNKKIENNKIEIIEIKNNIKNQQKIDDLKYDTILNLMNTINENVKDLFTKIDKTCNNHINLKKAYTMSDTDDTPALESTNEDIKTTYKIRKSYFTSPGRYEFIDKKLRNFLNDSIIENKALKLIKNPGEFCMFVADILIPKEAQLKYFFPTKRDRRPKNKLYSETIVKYYRISCKYLGSCIILEEETYMDNGIHIVNKRPILQNFTNSNVSFYTLPHKKTFFSLNDIHSQESDNESN
uniref:Uncharacterized protein n=1 Tax=Strongyloides stercoralis TaxID=6248 RepID=A0A0K0ENY9_STRER